MFCLDNRYNSMSSLYNFDIDIIEDIEKVLVQNIEK